MPNTLLKPRARANFQLRPNTHPLAEKITRVLEMYLDLLERDVAVDDLEWVKELIIQAAVTRKAIYLLQAEKKINQLRLCS